jgi:thioredoxin reductase (NADPH)
MKQTDLIIIGAGPAGLSAGIYAGYYGLKAEIFEENIPGGLASEIPLLEDYPGFKEGISGRSLVDKMVEQCKKLKVEIRQFEKVINLDFSGKKKRVETDKAKYTSDRVIIALGRHPETLGVPGENEFRGKGVSYCAVCDSIFFKNRNVVVIGEGSHAAEVALYLSDFSSSLVLVCLSQKAKAERIFLERLSKRKVEVLFNVEVKEIKGDVKVKSVVLSEKTTGRTREIETDGVFLQLEETPSSQLAEKSGIQMNEKKYIIVDEKGLTNIEGVYAVGDVTHHSIKKTITAAAQAAIAVNDIFEKRSV